MPAPFPSRRCVSAALATGTLLVPSGARGPRGAFTCILERRGSQCTSVLGGLGSGGAGGGGNGDVGG